MHCIIGIWIGGLIACAALVWKKNPSEPVWWKLMHTAGMVAWPVSLWRYRETSTGSTQRKNLILLAMLAALAALAQSPQDYVVMRAWEQVRRGAVAPVAVLWTPADLGDDLVMWLSSADTNKMSIVSGEIDRWTNSAPDYVSSVFTAENQFRRMELITDGLNGYPVARSAGSIDHGRWSGTNDLRAAAGYTTFSVMKLSNVPTADAMYLNYEQPSAGAVRWFLQIRSNQRYYIAARRVDGDAGGLLETATGQATINTNSFTMLSATVDFATRTGIIYADGVGLATNTALTTTGTLSSDTASGLVRIGDGSARLNGDWTDRITLRKGATLAEIQKLEGWAAHRYALTGLLPESHPWKNTPPTK